jgi:peptide/nickel transport system substrate-binding protein
MRTTTLALLAAAALIISPCNADAQKRGGTLTVGLVSDPVTLDPAFMGSYFENFIQFNLHETLVHMTPDMEIEPGLAEYRMIDDLTLELKLRPDLKFHDGTPIDAEAVKFNLDRYLDPKTGSARRSELGPVKSVDVIDARTVQIKMEQPYSQLLVALANRAGMMISPTALKTMGADFATKAVGAGPFKFVSWTKNGQFVLERFDGYWRKGMPYLDKIVFRPISDETVRLTNLRSGTAQLIDAVPPQSLSGLKSDKNVNIVQRDGVGFYAYSFNVRKPPFDDVRVRRAFVMSVDPNIIQRVVYFNTGRPAHGPIPPAVKWAFDPNFKGVSYDPAGAKKLLAEAGHPNGLSVTLTVTSSPINVRNAEIVQSQATQAGFKVQIRQIDASSNIRVLRAGDFEINQSTWSGRADPDGNMFNWFSEKGPNNFAGLKNPQISELLIKARRTLDRPARVKMYHEAQDLIAKESPMLFTHFDAIIQASRANLKWTQYPDGAFQLFDASLE